MPDTAAQPTSTEEPRDASAELDAPSSERRTPVDERIVRAVHALGVVVQRHRLYPSRSPLCRDAAAACRDALDEVWRGSPEVVEGEVRGSAVTDLSLRVASDRLYLELDPLPANGPITELGDRLFRADVEEVVIRQGVTRTELIRFCRRLAHWDRRRDPHLRLSEVLNELDVTGIRARDSERLEVLDFDIVASDRLEGLRTERRRRVREDGTGVDSSVHKAWARTSVDASAEPIDMIDLAYLVENQLDLAQMLFQLAEGETEASGSVAALRQTVTRLVHLYAGMSEDVAEARFRDLAASLMELEPEARRNLTRDVLIPDLLETGKSADLVRLLPDGEIVDAISTLADLEIGGQGLVRLALERLELPPGRLEVVLGPLLERSREEMGAARPDARVEVRLSSDEDVFRNLRAFSAHELAVGEETRARLEDVRERLEVVDGPAERLRCAVALVPHLRNPERAVEILRPLPAWLSSLLASDPEAAARQIRSLRDTARELEELDPELSDTVDEVLREVLMAEVVTRIAGPGEGAESDTTLALLEAFGPVAASVFVEMLETEERRSVRRSLLDHMCEHASFFAPLVERYVQDGRWTVVRNVVRVLGFAGPGYEAALAAPLDHADDRVVREALLALGRIGSPRAAEEIFARLAATDERRELAEDAMRRFPLDQGVHLTRRLLSKPEFYRDRPEVARLLIVRFFADGHHGSEALLRPLLGYRLRPWQPALMRLGWAASAVLRRGKGG
ncbi:MAG: HEAT repeat domain-containing protein [Gemmatimonadota bacterium]|nr:HEAT repeat domain-containing protein [Gemmatimonadota bacterium]